MNHVSDLNQFENILAEKDHSSYGLNTLGPLCLWQCLKKKTTKSIKKKILPRAELRRGRKKRMLDENVLELTELAGCRDKSNKYLGPKSPDAPPQRKSI